MIRTYKTNIVALSKFSEAILDYEANIEKAPDTSVTRDRYSADVFAAYEILNNVWSQTKETKVKVSNLSPFPISELFNLSRYILDGKNS